MPNTNTHREYRKKSRQRKRSTDEGREEYNEYAKKWRRQNHYGAPGEKRKWSPEEEEIVLSWEHSDKLLAKKLKRSVSAIYGKRAALVAQGREAVERAPNNGRETFVEGAYEVAVYLTLEQLQFAERAGHGNVSKGIRMALDREMRRKK